MHGSTLLSQLCGMLILQLCYLTLAINETQGLILGMVYSLFIICEKLVAYSRSLMFPLWHVQHRSLFGLLITRFGIRAFHVLLKVVSLIDRHPATSQALA